MVYGSSRIVFSGKKVECFGKMYWIWATKNIVKLVEVEKTLRKIGGRVGIQKDFALGLTHNSVLGLAVFWWETWKCSWNSRNVVFAEHRGELQSVSSLTATSKVLVPIAWCKISKALIY